MKDLASRAISTASVQGARYADVRIVKSRNQSVAMKNGKVESLGDFDSIGFGIRVLVGDAWALHRVLKLMLRKSIESRLSLLKLRKPVHWYLARQLTSVLQSPAPETTFRRFVLIRSPYRLNRNWLY